MFRIRQKAVEVVPTERSYRKCAQRLQKIRSTLQGITIEAPGQVEGSHRYEVKDNNRAPEKLDRRVACRDCSNARCPKVPDLLRERLRKPKEGTYFVYVQGMFA
jgi:hypothetical protein